MPKYVLYLLITPLNPLPTPHPPPPKKIFCLFCASDWSKGHNQRAATFWRRKSIEIDRLNCKLLICGPFRTQESSLQMHGFFMKCANVAFSVVPRIGDGDAEDWNRVWFRYGLLFWHRFGTVCFFFFHSDLPSAHCTTCWKWAAYKHRVCPSVQIVVCSRVKGFLTTATSLFLLE